MQDDGIAVAEIDQCVVRAVAVIDVLDMAAVVQFGEAGKGEIIERDGIALPAGGVAGKIGDNIVAAAGLENESVGAG